METLLESLCLLALLAVGIFINGRRSGWAPQGRPKAVQPRQAARPLDGLVRERPARPPSSPDRATKPDMSRPDLIVARTLTRACDEAYRDVSLPGSRGTVKISHIARRGGLLLVANVVRLEGRFDVDGQGSWSAVTTRDTVPLPDPTMVTAEMAQAAENASDGSIRVAMLTVNVGKATFEGPRPDGFVQLDGLEDAVVHLSDRHRGSVAAEEAMMAIRQAALRLKGRNPANTP